MGRGRRSCIITLNDAPDADLVSSWLGAHTVFFSLQPRLPRPRRPPRSRLLTRARADEGEARRQAFAMGNCLDCFKDRGDASDPIMNAEARARAAEAAQARQEAYSNSTAGKRDAASRKKASAPGPVSADAHRQRINDIIS